MKICVELYTYATNQIPFISASFDRTLTDEKCASIYFGCHLDHSMDVVVVCLFICSFPVSLSLSLALAVLPNDYGFKTVDST